MIITLTSSDNQSFPVEREVLKHAGTIESLISAMGLDDTDMDTSALPIPLPKVTGKALEQVVKWLEQHKGDPVYVEKDADAEKRTDDIPEWDLAFLSNFAASDVLAIMLAANYLDIKLLLELSIKHTAHAIKYKTRDELREYFDIENDYSPEEEEQIIKENEWCEN